MTRQTRNSECRGQGGESSGALVAAAGSHEFKLVGGAFAPAAEGAPGSMHGGSCHVAGGRRERRNPDPNANVAGKDTTNIIHEYLKDAAARTGI